MKNNPENINYGKCFGQCILNCFLAFIYHFLLVIKWYFKNHDYFILQSTILNGYHNNIWKRTILNKNSQNEFWKEENSFLESMIWNDFYFVTLFLYFYILKNKNIKADFLANTFLNYTFYCSGNTHCLKSAIKSKA